MSQRQRFDRPTIAQAEGVLWSVTFQRKATSCALDQSLRMLDLNNFLPIHNKREGLVTRPERIYLAIDHWPSLALGLGLSLLVLRNGAACLTYVLRAQVCIKHVNPKEAGKATVNPKYHRYSPSSSPVTSSPFFFGGQYTLEDTKLLALLQHKHSPLAHFNYWPTSTE